MFYLRLVVLFIICTFLFSGCGSKSSDMFKDRKNSVEATIKQDKTRRDMEKFEKTGVLDLSDDVPVTNMKSDFVSFEFEHLQ